MASWSRGRIGLILGWLLAGALALLYLSSRFDISIRKRSAIQPAPETSVPRAEKERQPVDARRPPEMKPPPRVREPTVPTPEAAQLPPPPTLQMPALQLPQGQQPSVRQAAELTGEELFKHASPAVALIEVFDEEGHKRGIGSGFVVGADGSAVTNYHVIRGAFRAVARLQDGTARPVIGVIGYDSNHDVAVVKLEAGGTPLELGDSDEIRVGQKIVAIGSPLGLQNTLSEGIVSGLRGGVIQMTTPISPGSSGGPVLDLRGKVVAIAVATVREGQNVNFAVPINWAKPYVGRSPFGQLSDITKQNTVIDYVINGTVSIPSGRAQEWRFTVNPNVMSNVELHGTFSSTGGVGNNIRVLLYRGQQMLYDSGRVARGDIHIPLQDAGEYVFAIDNTGSLVFARLVAATIAVRYVK